MNRVQSDKYYSLLTSQGLLKDNAAALATLPMVLAHLAELNAAMERIVQQTIIVEHDTSGYTEDKADKRQALVKTLLRLGRFARAYYLSTSNEEKEKLTSFTEGSVIRMPAADIYLFAGKLHDSLLADAPLMPGSAPTDIVQLAADTAAFYAVIDSPANIRKARKAAAEQTIEEIKAADAICQKIDVYMCTLIDGPQDMLYQLWRASRNIDRTGVKTKKKD